MADPYVLLDDATDMLDQVYEMEPVVQEGRFGTTAQHIKKETPFTGGKIEKKLLNMIYSGARATADLEADAPDPVKIDVAPIQIDEDDLRRLSITITHSIQAGMEVDGSKHAVWNLATQLALQSLQAIGEKRNQMLNSDSNAQKALVVEKYDPNGAAYGTSAADSATGNASGTRAFLKIDSGSISAFHMGEIIDIHAADASNIRIIAKVLGVIHDTYMRGLAVGPGIVCQLATDSTYATGGDDNTFANVVDGDMIVNRGEAAGCGYAGAFNALMDITASPGAYFGETRATYTNQYLVPYGRDYSTGGTYGNGDGTKVNLDIDTHLGPFADLMGMLIPPARAYRNNGEFQMTSAMVCQAQPDLVNEIARLAGDGTQRFTKRLATDLDAATRAKLVAQSGWVGSVIFHPSMPDCSFPTDSYSSFRRFKWGHMPPKLLI